MTDVDTSAAISDTALRIERVIGAPPERLFDAWLDPASVARFLSPTARARAEIDGTIGGRFRVIMLGDEDMPVPGGTPGGAPGGAPGGGLEHTGEYLQIDRYRRLSFTWVSPFTGPQPSVVTIDFQPVGNATRLTLRHERLPAAEVAAHANGWGSILDHLARLAAEA